MGHYVREYKETIKWFAVLRKNKEEIIKRLRRVGGM